MKWYPSPLTKAIYGGRIKGVVKLIGCKNPRVVPGASELDLHVDLAKDLLAYNVLILTTGCARMAFGSSGTIILKAASLAEKH
jgi:carbon-monoxide dehydrogenase catalytic subunit